MTKKSTIDRAVDILDDSGIPHIVAAIDPEGRGVGHAVHGKGSEIIGMVATVIGESFDGKTYKTALAMIEALIEAQRKEEKND